MEMLDAVDDSDRVIMPMAKLEIYAKKLAHRIVHILVFNSKGDMLLQKRSGSKGFLPGYWSTAVGGHVQAGESYEDAAMRECREEIGIFPKIAFLAKDLYPETAVSPRKFLSTFTAVHEGPFHPNPKEVQKVTFFSLAEIQRMADRKEHLHPELLFLLRKHYGVETQ